MTIKTALPFGHPLKNSVDELALAAGERPIYIRIDWSCGSLLFATASLILIDTRHLQIYFAPPSQSGTEQQLEGLLQMPLPTSLDEIRSPFQSSHLPGTSEEVMAEDLPIELHRGIASALCVEIRNLQMQRSEPTSQRILLSTDAELLALVVGSVTPQ